MNETEIINLSKYNVEVKTTPLTWGEKETLRLYLIRGYSNGEKVGEINPENLMEVRYKRIEYAIVSIKEGDKVIPFSRDFVLNLNQEDGTKLYDFLNEVDTKKKEKSQEVK